MSTTTTTLTRVGGPVGPASTVYGTSVPFRATIGGSPAPGSFGTVTFKDGGIAIAACTALPVSSSIANCPLSTLSAAGTPHSITAEYTGGLSGSNQLRNSTSSALLQSITPKPITITPNSGQSKVFGAANPTLTFTNTALVGTDTFTGALGRAAGENVGTYAINLGMLSAGTNYALSPSSPTVNFSITPKPITITPNSGQSNVVFGAANPTLNSTNTALVGTDTFTGALGLAPRARTSATTRSPWAACRRARTTRSACPATVNFAITPKAVTITPNSGQSKVFGQR